ncbi:MAG: LCP family protein [Pseudoclavibacter sp.]
MTPRSTSKNDPLRSLLDGDGDGDGDGAAGGRGGDGDASGDDGSPRRRRKRLWGILIAIGAVVVLAVAAVAVFFQMTAGQIETFDIDVPDESRPDAVEPDESGNAPMNILLLGSDSRVTDDSLLTELGSRADTIMVAHIPADRSSVQVMSIMRDSWVEIPGHGENKINSALSFGGVSLMVQTVEQVIGQRIDHVGIIGFEGFTGLSEAVGGVTVNNEVAFESKEFTFEAGEITLEGEAALAYVRARYNFPDGDYQRVRNQQAFMKGLLSQILSNDTLGNPTRVTQLLTTMAPHMATDSGLTTQLMLGLATDMQSVRSGDVDFFTIPTTGTGMMGDQSVVFVDWPRMEEVRAGFANDTLDEFEP